MSRLMQNITVFAKKTYGCDARDDNNAKYSAYTHEDAIKTLSTKIKERESKLTEFYDKVRALPNISDTVPNYGHGLTVEVSKYKRTYKKTFTDFTDGGHGLCNGSSCNGTTEKRKREEPIHDTRSYDVGVKIEKDLNGNHNLIFFVKRKYNTETLTVIKMEDARGEPNLVNVKITEKTIKIAENRKDYVGLRIDSGFTTEFEFSEEAKKVVEQWICGIYTKAKRYTHPSNPNFILKQEWPTIDGKER